MSILLDVTKYFLLKGIDEIIKKSEAADHALSNKVWVLFFKEGRNTKLSQEKRDILQALREKIDGIYDGIVVETLSTRTTRVHFKELGDAGIDTDEERIGEETEGLDGAENIVTEYVSDELSFRFINEQLCETLKKLESVCSEYSTATDQTDADFYALKHFFFEQMQQKSILDENISKVVDPFNVKNKKIDLNAPNDPFEVLLYYLAMYQAKIIFDEHNSSIKHSNEYIQHKISMIMVHIHSYHKRVEDLKSFEPSELLQKKSDILVDQINLIIGKSQSIYKMYQYVIFGSSMLTPYKDWLDEYMTEAIGVITGEWLVQEKMVTSYPN